MGLLEVLSVLVALLIILFSFIIFAFNGGRGTKKKNEFFKKIPGPNGLPIVGISLELISTTVILDVLHNYSKQYGGFLKMKLGLDNQLLVSDEKFLRFLLGTNHIISKSPDYKFLHSWLGTGLLTSEGKKWKQRRKILTPTFHFKILEEFIDVFEKVGNIMISKLKEVSPTESIDIYSYVTLCTLDVICETAMGTTVNAQENKNPEYVSSVKEMGRILIERAFAPTQLFYSYTSNYRSEKKALQILHNYTKKVIRNRKEQLESNIDKLELQGKKKMAFLDLLLQAEIEGQPLSDEDIREEVDTFMFEGHDTTASAISFTLYCLANHPLIQEKAFREQQTLFGENIKDCEVSYQNLQQMSYLENVIKETLRLYPSVPFYGREVKEDVEYDGMLIPEGVSITIFAFGIHRNPEFFPNPEIFKPDRFENDQETPFTYIPFSAGSRNCIGRRFAMLEMKSLISLVLRNFELIPAYPEHKLQLAAEAVLKSANGIKIGLKNRTPVV